MGDAEVFQPAEMVFLTAFQLNNVHLLLLSGIGRPYDPAGGTGVGIATALAAPVA